MIAIRLTVALNLIAGVFLAPTAARADSATRKPADNGRGDPLPPGALVRIGEFRLRHRSHVYSVSFSPDGTLLASGGPYDDVRIWSVATGRLGRKLTVGGAVDVLTFAPDRPVLAIGTYRSLRLWDATTGQELARADYGRDSVLAVAFSPDGKRLAVGDNSRGVGVRDAVTGRELWRLTPHSHVVRCVAFSPDGSLLASGSSDTTICLSDAATGRELRRLRGHTGYVQSLAFAPDGRRLVSASGHVEGQDHTVRVWDVATGQEVRGLQESGPSVLTLAYAAEGRQVIAGASDGSIRVWEAATGRELRRWNGHVNQVHSIACSPDGQTVASGGSDGTVRLWELATGRELHAERPGPKDGSVSAALSPNGRLLATGGWKSVSLWDVTTGRLVRALDGVQYAYAVHFSPNGATLAACDHAGFVLLWDVLTGRELRRLNGPTGGSFHRLHSLTFSPDGQRLAAAGVESVARVWDVATGQVLKDFHGSGQWLFGVGFSADGRHLASWEADQDRRVHLWETATGREGRGFRVGGSSVHPLLVPIHYSPRVRLLYVGSEQREVVLGDAQGGAEYARLVGHQAEITHCAVSADGTTLATADRGGVVRVWEVPSCQELLSLKPPQVELRSLALSATGAVLVTADVENTAIVWDVPRAMGFQDVPPRGPRQDLGRLWDDLAGNDARRAYAALNMLSAASDDAVQFMEMHLPPAGEGAAEVNRLIADLDHERFAVREAATRRLAGLGGAAEPWLRKALGGKPSPEARRRLESVLGELTSRPTLVTPGEPLRRIRAIQLLERINTSAARRLLERIAGGASDAPETADAQAALRRVGRPASGP